MNWQEDFDGREDLIKQETITEYMFGRITPVVKNLIIINVIMFVATLLMGEVMYDTFSLFCFGSPRFRIYQLVSHMFMHGDFSHILFNMYGLFMFGTILENVWGSKKFLFYYLITGLGAALIHGGILYIEALSLERAWMAGNYLAEMKLNILYNTPTVGASGAIYGLLLAYGMLFPNNIIQLILPPVSLKAKWFVIIFGALEFLLGISNSGGQIAHFAHLGGMIFGYILIKYWKSQNRMYY